MKVSCLKTVVYALLTFAATTVVSCVGSGDKEKTPDVVKIDLDAKENVLKLSEIADTVTFVALETNEQSRFGNVDKLPVVDDMYGCIALMPKAAGNGTHLIASCLFLT